MNVVLSESRLGLCMLEKYDGRGISREMVSEAAKLFSQDYGVWGLLASEKMGEGKKKGSRIKISSQGLITLILPPGAQNTYVRLLIDGRLAGNVFATRWQHKNLSILWVTQLCVDRKYRNQGVAKKMLGYLKGEEEMVGILSSHPFALMAVLRVWGRGVEDTSKDLEMTRRSVKEVMEGCPVWYVKGARLRGSLFGEGDGGAVACADTQFWVDHEEPLEALRTIGERGIVWPFGELPDGCEFLVLVDAKVR